MPDTHVRAAGAVHGETPGAPRKLRRGARVGIKTKLQLAFGAVAIMTVVAAAVAIMSFSETERGFRARCQSREVPMMTDALRLSVASGEISAAAARFVSAKTSDDRKLIAKQIATRSRDLDAIMDRLRVGQGESRRLCHRRADGAEAEGESQGAGNGDLRAHRPARQARRAARSAAQDPCAISDKLTPIVDDSYFEVVTTAEDVGQSGDITVRTLIQGGMQVMQAMVEVGAETNLVTGLLTAGALTSSPGILALLEDRFTASARRAEKQLAKLPAGTKFEPLKERVRALVKLADFKPRAGESDMERLQQGVPRARAAHQAADRPDRRPQLRRGDAERRRGEALEQAGQGPRRGADHRAAQRARSRRADAPRHQPDQRSRRRQGRRLRWCRCRTASRRPPTCCSRRPRRSPTRS